MQKSSYTQELDPEFALFTEAAAGSADAYTALARWAVLAIDSGEVRVAEAIEAATSLNALAACVAGMDDSFPLGSLFDGATEDQAADIRLLYRSAAKGNVAALRSLAAQSLHAMKAGVVDELIGLTNAEIFARLGATTGDLEAIHLLVTALCFRADFEQRSGGVRHPQDVMLQAVPFALVMLAADDAAMQTAAEFAFKGLAVALTRSTFAELATAHPILLKFLEPEGSA